MQAIELCKQKARKKKGGNFHTINGINWDKRGKALRHKEKCCVENPVENVYNSVLWEIIMKFMLIRLNAGKKKRKGKLRTKKGEEQKNTGEFHKRAESGLWDGQAYMQDGYPQ